VHEKIKMKMKNEDNVYTVSPGILHGVCSLSEGSGVSEVHLSEAKV
jgi:hypothetical protein